MTGGRRAFPSSAVLWFISSLFGWDRVLRFQTTVGFCEYMSFSLFHPISVIWDVRGTGSVSYSTPDEISL
jgi:hypothetical protein